MNLLSQIYSGANTLKRKVNDFASNPIASLQQVVGNANDRARGLNDLTRAATLEDIQAIKAGERMGAGPKSNKLAQLVADAYNPAGMVVWHGSPHKFDKFDSSKIGTGEGAQVYGHGLYLAESQKVADEYAGKLSKKMVSVDGFGSSNVEKLILDRLSSRVNSTQHGGGAQAALNDLHSIARFGSEEEKFIANAMLNKIGPFGMPSVEDAGSLYKVDLPDEQIAKMLDWDTSLGGQSPSVKDAIHRVGRSPDAYGLERVADDMRMVEMQKLFQNREGVEALRKSGIPGIRYLDGVSRGAGAGTSNFVVFPGNENMLKILERNGRAMGNK